MDVSTRLRGKLTYANVMSTIAVFGVLGGGAWAAAEIGAGDIKKNAVRSKHIKNGQVKKADLADNAISLDAQVVIEDAGAPDFEEATPECPGGKVAVGGGLTAQKATTVESIRYVESAPEPPFGEPTGWDATAQWETGVEGESVRGYVICVNG